MFLKYPKIKYLGDDENKELLENPEDEIIMEEKVDGANTRFMIKNGRIIFGSRNVEIKTGNEGNFAPLVQYLTKKLKGKRIRDGLIVYGEYMTRHSIDYDWDRTPIFLGFDVYDLEVNKFLDYDEKVKVFNSLDLPIVPLIKKVKAYELKNFSENDVPKSNYYDGKAEGVVFKNYDKQVFAKFVTQKFKEVNKEAFGFTKKGSSSDEERFIAVYCTNARIDKMIFKLLNEGRTLGMELMKFLPQSVYEDIWEENWREISRTNWSLNFRVIKKLVCKRCVNVLKQIIIINARKEVK